MRPSPLPSGDRLTAWDASGAGTGSASSTADSNFRFSIFLLVVLCRVVFGTAWRNYLKQVSAKEKNIGPFASCFGDKQVLFSIFAVAELRQAHDERHPKEKSPAVFRPAGPTSGVATTRLPVGFGGYLLLRGGANLDQLR